MFDYDDDFPAVKTSWIEEWSNGKRMVRSLMTVSLTVGVAVGAVTVAALSTIERARS